MYPVLQGMTGVGTTPALQGQSGLPGSPYPVATLQGQSGLPSSQYPVAACRHNVETANLPSNVVTTGHFNEIRRQSEISDRERASEGADIDRQIAIAERNMGGRNIGQRDSN